MSLGVVFRVLGTVIHFAPIITQMKTYVFVVVAVAAAAGVVVVVVVVVAVAAAAGVVVVAAGVFRGAG